MRIFSWMHRRLCDKDGELFSRVAKKAEFVKMESDRDAIDDNVVVANMLDGWKDGILRIGTLGLDPLREMKEQQRGERDKEDASETEYDSVEEECGLTEIEMEDEEEILCIPLVYSGCKNDETNVEEAKVDSAVEIVEEESSKSERVTLAELFWADSDEDSDRIDADDDDAKGKVKQCGGGGKKGMSNAPAAKNQRPFVKKLIRGVGRGELRPFQKIHRLMNRILKKKIHPDMESQAVQKIVEAHYADCRSTKSIDGAHFSHLAATTEPSSPSDPRDGIF